MKVIITICIFFSAIHSFSGEFCDFYLKEEIDRSCVERAGDSSDYFTHYGYYYCRKFYNLSKRTSSKELATFINTTGLCLQRALDQEELKTLDCREVESYAFRSHPQCYLEGGYCELSPHDRLRIISLVAGLNVLFKVKKSLIQYLAVQKGCFTNNEHIGLLETYSIISDNFKDIKESRHGKIQNIFFSLPKTTNSTIDFFVKAVSILKYGFSTKETDALSSQYLNLKYSGMLNQSLENCFKTLSEKCLSELNVDFKIRSRSIKNIDINQKLDAISIIKR